MRAERVFHRFAVLGACRTASADLGRPIRWQAKRSSLRLPQVWNVLRVLFFLG